MKCPYCKGSGKVQGSEAAPAVNKVYGKEYPCECCVGGEVCCVDAAGADVTVGDEVTMTFRVANVRARSNPHTGKQDHSHLELLIPGPEGSWVHFAVVPSTEVTKCV
jgi:hypothetical protein